MQFHTAIDSYLRMVAEKSDSTEAGRSFHRLVHQVDEQGLYSVEVNAAISEMERVLSKYLVRDDDVPAKKESLIAFLFGSFREQK